MSQRYLAFGAIALVSAAAAASWSAAGTTKVVLQGDGVVRVKSAYGIEETAARIKQDIGGKSITFFSAVDQAKLAADAGIKLRPSTLLTFGNPPLGTQFITSNPNAGLDWPVRLLLTQDESNTVWAVYTDFAWSRGGTESQIAIRSSRWQPASSLRSPRVSRPSEYEVRTSRMT